MVKGVCGEGDMHDKGLVHGKGRAWRECVHSRKHGYCRGRYASYWNAILFNSVFKLRVSL